MDDTMIAQDLEVASCTLSELLNCSKVSIPNTTIKGQLQIPEYQRPYVWKEKQINKLLSDIIEYRAISKSKPFYYLGSIIIHNDHGALNIIDGQQRITTALLLQKFRDSNYKSNLSYSPPVSIANIKKNLSYLSKIQKNEISPFQDTDILPTLDFDKINITLVITKSVDLAYTFFETNNTGGIRLSGSDILKAHHLRSINDTKMVNYQAKKWESIGSDEVERIIQKLTKIRFWNNIRWRKFPFYRNKKKIKDDIIDEYTIRTLNDSKDVSYYYSTVTNKEGKSLHMYGSPYKQIRQPLRNGNNTLNFITGYSDIYNTLFVEKDDYRVDESFYEFRNILLRGDYTTRYLKELIEICILSYVSHFGFERLYEASLWLFRMIYSLRVNTARNLREDSVFNFVKAHNLIDNIIEVFTPDELFSYLRKYSYALNTENLEERKAKGRYIVSLKHYFGNIDIQKYTGDDGNKAKQFDRDLVSAIITKIKEHDHKGE